MIRALFRSKATKFEHGARVRTIRACVVGFFPKGVHGTVIGSAGDGSFRVRFDNGATHWADHTEIKRTSKRDWFFARLGLTWVWIWRRPIR